MNENVPNYVFQNTEKLDYDYLGYNKYSVTTNRPIYFTIQPGYNEQIWLTI